MSVLNKIIQHKEKEVAERKFRVPVSVLEKSEYFNSPVISLANSIQHPGKSGIIAEFKRRSPSQGIINERAEAGKTTKRYSMAGASALSVLTDQPFFGGSNEDLHSARQHNTCPILRKDFTIDEYQVLEARSIGADAILLIAAALTKEKIRQLSSLAHQLQIEVLFEIHSRDELDKLSEDVDIIGVNNRDLRNFSVSHERSLELYEFLPSGYIYVSESGIHSPEIAIELKNKGYDGFLIGEQFMKSSEPWEVCRGFIERMYAGMTPSGSEGDSRFG